MTSSCHSKIQRVRVACAYKMNAKTNGRWTALHIAAWNGHASVCALLLSGPKFRKMNAKTKSSTKKVHIRTIPSL